MNNLNSVVLEGKLIEIEKEDNSVLLQIETVRFYRENEESVKEICHFIIVLYSRLADYSSYCKIGDLLRIVGRLKETDNSVVVIAEHVERKGL
jgi:hypothetical protein